MRDSKRTGSTGRNESGLKKRPALEKFVFVIIYMFNVKFSLSVFIVATVLLQNVICFEDVQKSGGARLNLRDRSRSGISTFLKKYVFSLTG